MENCIRLYTSQGLSHRNTWLAKCVPKCAQVCLWCYPCYSCTSLWCGRYSQTMLLHVGLGSIKKKKDARLFPLDLAV